MAQYPPTLRRQASNGVWRAIAILTGVLVLGLVLDGERRIGRAMQFGGFHSSAIVALVELSAAAIVLWHAITRALRQIIAVLWLTALKSAIAVVTGASVVPPFQHVSRLVAAEMLAYLAVGSLLLLRLLAHRIGWSEKLAIIIFLFATSAALLYDLERFSMLTGLLVLVVAQLRSFRLPKAGGLPSRRTASGGGRE
jgi:hypothetical protein